MAKEIIMPKFGFTQEVGKVVAWLKQEGEYVEAGDPIMEVETDKVTMEIEAPATGYLAGLKVAAGDEVPVTEVIGYIVAEGEQFPQRQKAPQPNAGPTPAQASPSAKATPLAQRMAQTEALDLTTVVGTGPQGRVTKRDVEQALASGAALVSGKVRATPAARRIAREQNVALMGLVGTGPRQRVQAADVLAAQASPEPSVSTIVEPPVAAPPYAASAANGQSQMVRLPMSGMRQAIARNLQASWQAAPHIFFTADADLTAAQALIQRASSTAPEGVKVTLTAVILKAAAWALTRHPSINSHIDGDAIVQFSQVNLGVAVALENGLVVPVIQRAHQRGIVELAQETARLSAAAKAGKLRPDDLTGATFSVSNLGMYPVKQFTAIINPPQVGILAVGRAQRVFVPDENDQPVLKSLLSLTLSVDHRAVDGAAAAAFLGDVIQALTQPEIILL
ncbi:dihydrolipoamide acetyltransferase family protein [Aggregatilineales bacterium SYSU G02658]